MLFPAPKGPSADRESLDVAADRPCNRTGADKHVTLRARPCLRDRTLIAGDRGNSLFDRALPFSRTRDMPADNVCVTLSLNEFASTCPDNATDSKRRFSVRATTPGTTNDRLTRWEEHASYRKLRRHNGRPPNSILYLSGSATTRTFLLYFFMSLFF